MTKPYVYKMINKISGEFYYGSRIKEGCNPEESFDVYSTSNKLVSTLILENQNLWDKEIVFVGTKDDVLFTELQLIKKTTNDALSLNRVTFSHYRQSFISEINDNEYEEMFTKLGFRLKMARLKRKISQKEVCRILNISRATFQRVEAGCDTVAIGTYIKYLTYLGFADEFNTFATKDVIGDKFANYDLMQSRGR
jgi:DNA-binding XRE family transcriptional regulator